MNNDKGFTLLEVIAALAVVAIVSTSLFQMFVTSSYINKDARVMDVANVVAVKQAETFKAGPENYSDEHSNHDYSYYDGEGVFLASVPSLGNISTGAAIQVESDLQTLPDTPSPNSGYYPDFAGTLDLTTFTNCYVEITPTFVIGTKADKTGTYTPLPIQDSTKIKNNILPIRVDFPSGETNPASRTMFVANDSSVEAEFYVFNAKIDGLLPEQIVALQPVQGISSISYVPITSSSNTEYNLTLTVSTIIKGVSKVMFSYSANKYRHD